MDGGEFEGPLRLFLTRKVRTGERFAQHRGRDSTPNGAVEPMVVVRLRAQLPLVDLTAAFFFAWRGNAFWLEKRASVALNGLYGGFL